MVQESQVLENQQAEVSIEVQMKIEAGRLELAGVQGVEQ